MSQIVFAIDPGTTKSAWVNYQDGRPKASGICLNEELLEWLLSGQLDPSAALVIEMIASYGMAVGAEVFMTCVWIGRFIQASRIKAELMYRKEVKLNLCGRTNVKDPHIRKALIERFGPGRELAIGTKKTPGPLYGIRKDEWAALAVAVTYLDRKNPAQLALAVGGRRGKKIH